MSAWTSCAAAPNSAQPRTLGVQADALIPSDVVVPQAVNKGEAVVLTAPKSGVAKAIEEMADLFLPAPERRKRR
jgi:Flp pilus assembly CpaE family ATPase